MSITNKRLLNAFKHMLLRTVSYATIPLILAVSLIKLITYSRVLQKAQVIVIMHEGGFGHTITGPDVTRRLFPDKCCVFIALSEYKRHNWKVATLWHDVHVIFLPFSFGIGVGNNSLRLPCSVWLKQFISKMTIRFVQMVAGRHAKLLSIGSRAYNPPLSPPDLYACIPIPNEPSIHRLSPDFKWPIGYFILQQRVCAPPVRLPLKWRKKIRCKLSRATQYATHNMHVKLCGLYLRRKGENSSDISSARRVGSPLENYLPTIRLLNHAGYQVLLIGDVALNPSLFHEFNGMLVDSKNLSTDKEVFDLYAATEADIFIGEVGGSIWLPGINNIPRLIINAFPYFVGFPNSWVYYKTVQNQKGKLIDYMKLFSDHAYDYELKGMTVRNNSAEEIYEAVLHFLEDVSHGKDTEPDMHVVSKLPDQIWIKHINAKLSPAFLKLYERNCKKEGK